jgi:drug/metabolite transporter (DMT)-like permease
LRVAIAAVLLGVVARRQLRSLRGRWWWVILFAVAEISIPFPLIAAGEVHVASSLAAIIIASVPLLVTVLSLRFDPSERPTRARAIGLLIGFTGVIALVGIDATGSTAEALGALAIFVAAIGYAIGPMVVKLGMQGLDSRATMGAALLIAAVILAPFAAVDRPSRTPTLGAIAAVVTLGVLCTAIAFVVYALLIREAGTSRATVITYVNPVVAVALGVGLLGERPGAGAVAGLLLILAGSWLSTDGRLPPPLRRLVGPRRGTRAPPDAGPLPSGGDGGNDPRRRAGVHLHRPDLPGADALG